MRLLRALCPPHGTRNFAEYENPKRTFHDTVKRCQRKGLRFTRWCVTDMLEAGETLPATWSRGSPTDSAPPLSTHQATSISNWLSAFFFRHPIVTPRVPSCSVFDWLPFLRRAPTLWPLWDDPDPDAWPTDFDSLTEMFTTTTMM